MTRPVSLSFDLLETFVKLMENKGNAGVTARKLKINQPSMSKRLRYLQHKGRVLPRPWLEREGKTWKLTKEGEQALPAVRDLIHRYEQLTTFVEDSPRPQVVFACGRQAAVGFVRDALDAFYKANGTSTVRISTLRGEARIAGVANGSLDLAIVTHDEDSIRAIARRELHVETIDKHYLGLACGRKTEWARPLVQLTKNRKLSLSALAKFPLILPEADAGIRRTLDEKLRKQGLFSKLDIRLEVGGWRSILSYVQEGRGVGLLSESALRKARGLVFRAFEPSVIPPTDLKLICRRQFENPNAFDLSPAAQAFYEALKQAAKKGT